MNPECSAAAGRTEVLIGCHYLLQLLLFFKRRYKVTLTEEERRQLETLTHGGKTAA